MVPQYQFNLGQVDPTLNVPNNLRNIDDYINSLENYKRNVINIQPNNQPTVWDDINTEVTSLTEDQKKMLFNDENYVEMDSELQAMIQQELINMVKPKILSSPTGSQLLVKQLNYIKAAKKVIIDKTNQDIELFKKFQIASTANPNLTYPEFIKSINQE